MPYKPTFSVFLDIFYPPNFDYFAEWSFSTPTPSTVSCGSPVIRPESAHSGSQRSRLQDLGKTLLNPSLAARALRVLAVVYDPLRRLRLQSAVHFHSSFSGPAISTHRHVLRNVCVGNLISRICLRSVQRDELVMLLLKQRE